MVEKFSVTEVSVLRNELLQGGLDTVQAGQLVQMFLMGRGYGVSPEAAVDAVGRAGGRGFSLESIATELEKLALVQ